MLFIFENNNVLRIVDGDNPRKEIQNATLSSGRTCTCFSWNRTGKLLALVIDKRYIYLWDIEKNSFTNYDWASNLLDSKAAIRRKGASYSFEITLIAWSNLSDRLVTGHSGGQLLISNIPKNSIERFIDNSDGLLKKAIAFYVSDKYDLFACISSLSELIIVSFDGEIRSYVQENSFQLSSLKFTKEKRDQVKVDSKKTNNTDDSYLDTNNLHELAASKLSVYSQSDLRFAILNNKQELICQTLPLYGSYNFDFNERIDLIYNDGSRYGQVVNYEWLGDTHIMIGYSTGWAVLLKLIFNYNASNSQNISTSNLSVSRNDEIDQNQDNSNKLDERYKDKQNAINSYAIEKKVFPLFASSRVSISPTSSSLLKSNIKVEDESSTATTSVYDDIDNQMTSFNVCEVSSFIDNNSLLLTQKRVSNNKDDIEKHYLIAATTSYQFVLFYLSLNLSDLSTSVSRTSPISDDLDNISLSSFLDEKDYEVKSFDTPSAIALSVSSGFSFERVDDFDVTNVLKPIQQKLERAEWCCDGSVLAVQLTNGHLIGYQTRHGNQLMSAHNSKIAFLSALDEITFIDFYDPSMANVRSNTTSNSNSENKSDIEESTSLMSNQTNRKTNSASPIPSVSPAIPNPSLLNTYQLKLPVNPTVICIGPKHLAFALNNKVWYYLQANQDGQENNSAVLIEDIEYTSIVKSLKLCSTHVAVMFDDGRCKLHSINMLETIDNLSSIYQQSSMKEDTNDDKYFERFFPDIMMTSMIKPEIITTICLTETNFIFSTNLHEIVVFSLNDYITIQRFNYANSFFADSKITFHITGMKQNKFGTLIACLTSQASDNFFVYSVCQNNVQKAYRSELLSDIYDVQMKVSELPSLLVNDLKNNQYSEGRVKFSKIVDCLWDFETGSILLDQIDRIDMLSIVESSLQDYRNNLVILHAISMIKPSSYTLLYTSQGIVSYQTNMGKIVNLVFNCYDEDTNLMKIEDKIATIKQLRDNDKQKKLTYNTAMKIIKLKLLYMRRVLKLYTLDRCLDICDHLINEECYSIPKSSSNLEDDESKDEMLILNRCFSRATWLHLASWALFNMNIGFALKVYLMFGFANHVRALNFLLLESRNLTKLGIPELEIRIKLCIIMDLPIECMQKHIVTSSSEYICEVLKSFVSMKGFYNDKNDSTIISFTPNFKNIDETLNYITQLLSTAVILEVDEERYDEALKLYERAYMACKLINQKQIHSTSIRESQLGFVRCCRLLNRNSEAEEMSKSID